MNQNTLITIVVLILVSSQLWNIIWDVGKAAVYIIILLLVLSYINPEMATNIKEYIKRMINLDTSLVTNSLSSISGFILNVFNKIKNIQPANSQPENTQLINNQITQSTNTQTIQTTNNQPINTQPINTQTNQSTNNQQMVSDGRNLPYAE
jgi:hypothetical protein